MKILLVNDYYEGGGAESVFRTTYNLLKSYGYEVDYFVGEKEIKTPKGILSYLNNKDAAESLKQKLELFQPTVVHIHNFYHFISGSIFSVLKNYKKNNSLKIVFTAHDCYLISPSSGLLHYKNKSPFVLPVNKGKLKHLFFKSIDHRGPKYSIIKKLQWWYNIEYKKIVSEIDLIISPSNFLKNTFSKSGVSKEIQVIRNPYNGTSTKEVKTPTSKAINLIFTGRLSKEKGILLFLESLVKNNITEITLDIFGKGEQEEVIKDYIEKHHLNFVKLHGYLTPEKLSNFIQKANVLLLPSVCYENAPLSIIESAFAGNVILASDLGGASELAKLSTSYVLVKDWDKDLKKSIQILKTKTQNKLIEKDLFSNESYINNLIKIYK